MYILAVTDTHTILFHSSSWLAVVFYLALRAWKTTLLVDQGEYEYTVKMRHSAIDLHVTVVWWNPPLLQGPLL